MSSTNVLLPFLPAPQRTANTRSSMDPEREADHPADEPDKISGDQGLPEGLLEPGSWGARVVLDRGELGYEVFGAMLPELRGPEVKGSILYGQEPRTGVQGIRGYRHVRSCEGEHGVYPGFVLRLDNPLRDFSLL